MGKSKISEKWNNATLNLIDHNSRTKTFLVLTSIIFSLIGTGCTIINFINNEIELGIIAASYLVAFIALLIVEIVMFRKNKVSKTIVFEVITTLLIMSLSILYVFFAPSYTIYLFWINIAPIFLCLFFGHKKGLIASLTLLAIMVLIFAVPPISNLTRGAAGSENDWVKKALLVLYYSMCTLIGYLLSLINGTIVKKLEKIKDIYYQDANTDSVTGLKNQAYYLSYVNNLNLTVQEGETIGLMFIDIDDFKIYNDKYGHTVGNEILIEVAKKLNEIPHALCARWGGDEFAIVERNLTRDELVAKANYLLTSVAGIKNGVTISIGLAYYTVDKDFDFEKIFNEADMQAIRAKGKGKNCIVFKDD